MMRKTIAFLLMMMLGFSQVQAQSFYREDGGSFKGFGGAMAMANGEIYVGSAPIAWPGGSDPAGVVYRFARGDDGNWYEAGRISASDGMRGDNFGRSVVMEDGMMLVGAPGKSAVYVFEWKEEEWVEIGTITPGVELAKGFEFSGAHARGGFRTQNMAKIGDHFLVSSYNADTKEGAVYQSHHMGNAFHNLGNLVEVPIWSMTSSGNFLYLGSPDANEGMGGLMIFELVAGRDWVNVAEFSRDQLGAGAALGKSLAASGNTVYVGATGAEQSGAVVVFERDPNGQWGFKATLQQAEPEEGARRASNFGQGLALSGSDLLVGASSNAFLFNTNDLASGYKSIKTDDDQARRGFGVGLAIEGDVLAIGSPNAYYESGVATAYERAEDGFWDATGSLMGDVDYLDPIVTEEPIRCEDGEAALFPCDNVDLVSFISTGDLVSDRGANLNDIWGWEDPETGKEYILAGRTDGLSFIDISRPSNPLIVGQLMRTEGTPGSWWRDVKVYRNFAYIVADGAQNHGMQIFDLTRLRGVDPADMPLDFDVSALYTGVASSHNIIINEETGFAYAVGSGSGAEGCGGQLHMLDLRDDPLNPKFVGCYTNPDSGGTHDAQCVTYHGSDADHRGQEICLMSNGNAFIIADVTDKANPTTITLAKYPNTAYTHQGWLSEDHNYFYMNDELDEMNKIVDRTRTLIWDVRDLDDPILVNEFFHNNGASDHNLYIKGNFMYQSNYQAGLRILDITDPENPVEAGHFDTAPYAENVNGFSGSWSNYPYFKSGIIAVSSQAEGIFLVRKREVDL